MKIQIDTDLKIIKLDSKENLGKLIAILSKMVDNWEEYSIDTNTTINWSNPIVIERPYWIPWYDQTPYWTLTGTCNAGTGVIDYKNNNVNNSYSLASNSKGIYNIDLKD